MREGIDLMKSYASIRIAEIANGLAVGIAAVMALGIFPPLAALLWKLIAIRLDTKY